MSSSTMALLPQRSASSRRELTSVMAPASYSRSTQGPPGGTFYGGAYPGGAVAVPYAAGGAGSSRAVAMSAAMAGTGGPFPPAAPSNTFVDRRWVHTEPEQPKQRPILSPHGYYMCIAVSIVVAIGLVVAFGFFIIQRRFAQAVVHK